MVSIKEISIGAKKEREAFLNIPFRQSKQFPTWIPGLKMLHRQLLNPSLNPFLKETRHHFFLAEEKEKAVGRVALFGPGHWKNESRLATVGFIDFAEDTAVCQQLLQQAEVKATLLGATKVVGPLNPNIHYDVGLLTNGFELPNAVFMGYNPQYYAAAFEQAGWKPVRTFQSWNLRKEDFKPSPVFVKIAERAKQNPSLRIRKINIRKFQDELAIFYQLYCESFAGHWGFTSPSPEEFRFIAQDLRYLLKPEMGMIAEWNGNPVGFVLGIPEINELLKEDRSGRLFPLNWYRLFSRVKKLKTMRVMIAGVLPDFQGSGIFAALFKTYTDNLFTNGGIESGEIGWVMKGNSSMEKALQNMGAVPVKEYTLFEKDLLYEG